MRLYYALNTVLLVSCVLVIGWMLNEGLEYREARKAVRSPDEFTKSQLSLCTSHLRRVVDGDDEMVRRLRSAAYWRGAE